MAETDFVTTRQAAEILDCAPQHVRLLISQGRIRSRMFGTFHLVDRESVMDYLKNHRQFGRGRPRKKKTKGRKR